MRAPSDVRARQAALYRMVLSYMASRHRGLEPRWHVVNDAGEPGWQSGWQNFIGGGFFRKDDYGMVHIALMAPRNPIGTGGTMFTLPLAYRPPVRRVMAAVITDAGGTFKEGRIDVLTDGQVIAQSDARIVRAANLQYRL